MAEALVGWRDSLRHCVEIAARGDKRSPPKPVRLLPEGLPIPEGLADRGVDQVV